MGESFFKCLFYVCNSFITHYNISVLEKLMASEKPILIKLVLGDCSWCFRKSVDASPKAFHLPFGCLSLSFVR